jgi:tetratricopeptide (TPR) repeat protein
LEKNLEEHPNFIPTLIPFGVLQTAVGTLPDDYKSVASLFGFEGDIEAGLKMIRKAYYYSLADPKLSFHRDYFGYVYAYANFELKTSEQVSLFTLDMKVKQSTFFSYLEAQMRLQQGDAERALDLMRNRPKGSTYLEVPFFEYYTGKLALMVKPDLAVEHLNTFLETSRDNEHRKSAYRYLAWYHLLKGSEEKAEAFRQRILTEPETLTGSDKQALAEAKRGFNLALIKARLDFDAGRYAKVVENLNDKSFKKHCKEDWERQEFHYRKARALQELGLVDQAILSFMQALNYQEVMSFSLANSTLQLAILFEGKGNIQKSRQYYQAALKLKDYPFHEGVQQKAKAGLGRLP